MSDFQTTQPARQQISPNRLTSPTDTLATWSWASASLWNLSIELILSLKFTHLFYRLLVLASCLVFCPRFLLFMSEPAWGYRSSLTALESFLALHFGIWLCAIALALVLNASVRNFELYIAHAFMQIPSTPQSVPLVQPLTQPYQPLLGPLTAAASLSAFLAWNTTSVGSLSLAMFIVSFIVGVWGLWAVCWFSWHRYCVLAHTTM